MGFALSTLHQENPVSAAVLQSGRARLLAGGAEIFDVGQTAAGGFPLGSPASPGTPGTPGSPRTPGTPGTRGRRRPPVGRGVRAISRPTGRGRATVGATIGPMVVGGGRNVRALRSPRVQQKLQKAHEAVVNAMMHEDERAEVVKPTYWFRKLCPTTCGRMRASSSTPNFPFFWTSGGAEAVPGQPFAPRPCVLPTVNTGRYFWGPFHPSTRGGGWLWGLGGGGWYGCCCHGERGGGRASCSKHRKRSRGWGSSTRRK